MSTVWRFSAREWMIPRNWTGRAGRILPERSAWTRVRIRILNWPPWVLWKACNSCALIELMTWKKPCHVCRNTVPKFKNYARHNAVLWIRCFKESPAFCVKLLAAANTNGRRSWKKPGFGYKHSFPSNRRLLLAPVLFQLLSERTDHNLLRNRRFRIDRRLELDGAVGFGVHFVSNGHSSPVAGWMQIFGLLFEQEAVTGG